MQTFPALLSYHNTEHANMWSTWIGKDYLTRVWHVSCAMGIDKWSKDFCGFYNSQLAYLQCLQRFCMSHMCKVAYLFIQESVASQYYITHLYEHLTSPWTLKPDEHYLSSLGNAAQISPALKRIPAFIPPQPCPNHIKEMYDMVLSAKGMNRNPELQLEDDGKCTDGLWHFCSSSSKKVTMISLLPSQMVSDSRILTDRLNCQHFLSLKLPELFEMCWNRKCSSSHHE